MLWHQWLGGLMIVITSLFILFPSQQANIHISDITAYTDLFSETYFCFFLSALAVLTIVNALASALSASLNHSSRYLNHRTHLSVGHVQ